MKATVQSTKLKPRHLRRYKPVKSPTEYQRIWKIVDGAVRDCLKMHDDYVSPAKVSNLRRSITKRVTGAMVGHMKAESESSRGSRARGTSAE